MLRPKLNRIWANGSANRRRDPGESKYIQGWISEIPTYQVLNFLQYKVDTTLLAQAERGIFEWGNDVTYTRGALAWDSLVGAVFVATDEAPSISLAPSNNPTQWVRSSVGISRNQYDTIVANITAHIADITGNPHQLTPARLNAYTRAETDALVNQYRAMVAAHANDTNNPHKLTATQIGAVPVTGGTYSGDVVFATGKILLNPTGTNLVGIVSGGVYLQSAGGMLGITSAGVPMAGTNAAQSKIVLESTFANLKAAVEPNYASVQPDFEMQLNRDINIYRGSGTSETNWNEAYSSDGAYALQITPGLLNRLTLSDNPVEGSTQLTVAFDVDPGNLTPSNDAVVWRYGTGVNAFAIVLNTGRTIRADVTSHVSIPQGWSRIVISSSPTFIKIYINGVLMSTTTISRTNPLPVGGFTLDSNSAATTATYVYIRNWRSWRTALTDKQISAL